MYTFNVFNYDGKKKIGDTGFRMIVLTEFILQKCLMIYQIDYLIIIIL